MGNNDTSEQRAREAEKRAAELTEENTKSLNEMRKYQLQLQESKEQLKKLRLNVNVMIRNILQDVCMIS